jgi:hypothetical protein
VALAAGCTGAEDYAVLRLFAGELAEALGVVASPPAK